MNRLVPDPSRLFGILPEALSARSLVVCVVALEPDDL
jgi:hypothetical protein